MRDEPTVDEATEAGVVKESQSTYWRADGYVCGTWDDRARISIADAEETLKAIALLAGSRPLSLLVDMRGIQTLDRDARRDSANPTL